MTLTSAQMVAIIQAGGAVAYGYRTITRVADVPSDAQIAADTAALMNAATSDLLTRFAAGAGIALAVVNGQIVITNTGGGGGGGGAPTDAAYVTMVPVPGLSAEVPIPTSPSAGYVRRNGEALEVAANVPLGDVTGLAAALSAKADASALASEATTRANDDSTLAAALTAEATARAAADAARLVVANNLSDVANKAAARTNLGLDGRTAIADAAYTALATDKYIGYTSLSAARVVTLPAANSVNAGSTLTVADESGNASAAQTISIQRSGTDLINGQATYVLGTAYGSVVLRSNGVNAWFFDVQGVGRGGTSATTAAGARQTLGLAATPRPAWNNLKAWTCDPVLLTNTGVIAAGVVVLAKLVLPADDTISAIWCYIGTAGAGLTANQNLAALFDSAGTRLAITGDQSSAWATTGAKSMPLVASIALNAGTYYGAFLVNGTTSPTFLRPAGLATNIGLAQADGWRSATILSGQTALPSSVTIASAAASSGAPWVALS